MGSSRSGIGPADPIGPPRRVVLREIVVRQRALRQGLQDLRFLESPEPGAEPAPREVIPGGG